MNNTIQLRSDYHGQKDVITQQLAEISGLDLKKIYDNYECYLEKLPQLDSCNFFEPESQNVKTEPIGLKADIDQLYLWTKEESTRHLLSNIFCLW